MEKGGLGLPFFVPPRGGSDTFLRLDRLNRGLSGHGKFIGELETAILWHSAYDVASQDTHWLASDYPELQQMHGCQAKKPKPHSHNPSLLRFLLT